MNDPLELCTSRAMQSVREMIAKIAGTDVTVLLRGESGVGKEIVARAIHNTSPRANKLLLKINCAAMPGELLESELFGHQKGAFTGAYRDKPGKFEVAHGGTLMLDEIGERSEEHTSELQSRLDLVCRLLLEKKKNPERKP